MKILFVNKVIYNPALTLIMLFVILAAACTNQPARREESTAIPAATSTENAPDETSLYTPPTRPDIELTEDILYKLLVAEIAGQRGHLDISVSNYLDLARTTRDPEIAGRATRIAVYARDDKAAYSAAKIWLELDPANIDAHQVVAVMAVRAGDLDTAMNHFQYIIKNSPEIIDQKLWVIANLLSKEQDQQVALQIMDRLMEGHQDDPDALYAYAHVMSRLNQDDKSLEILEKVLSIVPDNVNANISYVSLLQKKGRSSEAIKWLQQSLDKNQNNFNLRLFYARLLTDEKRFDDARRQFEILATEAPNNTDVLYALGLLYLQADRMDEARTYFERLSKLGERPDEVNYYLGRIAEEQDDNETAMSWYQNVQEGNNYFDAQIRIALLLAKTAGIEEARQHLQNIKVENEDQKIVLIQAEGELLTDEKHYAEAMRVYSDALANNPDPDLLYSRAMLAEKMDRLDILEQDLKKILEMDPNHAQALNALGYTLADRTDRYQEAYTFIKKALDLKPDDFYILDSMGWVLYRLGRLDESIKYLNRALNERQDPEIAAHLGEVLWVKGDRAAAKEIWEAALQQTPEDRRLLDVIKRFNP